MAKSTSALPSDPRWTKALDLPQPASSSAFPALQIPAINQFIINGLQRGTLLEASGPRSSGKTALCLQILAHATQNGEVCAIVDLNDCFHPDSAFASGVQLERLLWVRCKCNPEYTMKSADLLLHAGGFGVILLDLGDAPTRILNRIPISYWYRFQRAIQHTPTILLVCANAPQAKAAARESLICQTKSFSWLGTNPFARLRGLTTLVRQRKVTSIQPHDPLQILVP